MNSFNDGFQYVDAAGLHAGQGMVVVYVVMMTHAAYPPQPGQDSRHARPLQYAA